MERSTGYLLGGIFLAVIISVTVIVALGKDATILVGFLGSVIAALVALVGSEQAKKARKASDEAAVASRTAAASSAQAVHNTNGRMSEIIQLLQSQGIPIPPGYEEFMSPAQAAVTPVADPSPTNWQPFTD